MNKTTAPELNELNRVCHDLRNLLTAVLGYAGMLPDAPAAKVSDFAESIQKAARRMVEIINDALDRAKMLNGTYKAPNREFELAAQILDIVKVFQAQADSKKIGISVDIGSDVPATVTGSPMHICEILSNFLSNSLKFVPPTGAIAVRAELAHLPKSVRFSVTDNGAGMPAELCQRLFQPFVQGDHAEGGSGLGLALCQRLVKEIDGQIGVTSELGQGSTFFFTVPFPQAGCQTATNHQSPDNAPLETSVVSQGQSLRADQPTVLIVDDNESVSTLLQSVLSQFGYKADLAVDAQSALASLRSKHYSVLLVDAQLGQTSGAELIAAIRLTEAKAASAHVPIIGTSGYGDPLELMEAGANGFLAKPFLPRDLTSKIEEVLAA
jgi:CheY-like chemotaxis protein